MVVGEDPPALRELSVPLMAEEEFSHQTTKRERTRPSTIQSEPESVSEISYMETSTMSGYRESFGGFDYSLQELERLEMQVRTGKYKEPLTSSAAASPQKISVAETRFNEVSPHKTTMSRDMHSISPEPLTALVPPPSPWGRKSHSESAGKSSDITRSTPAHAHYTQPSHYPHSPTSLHSTSKADSQHHGTPSPTYKPHTPHICSPQPVLSTHQPPCFVHHVPHSSHHVHVVEPSHSKQQMHSGHSQHAHTGHSHSHGTHHHHHHHVQFAPTPHIFTSTPQVSQHTASSFPVCHIHDSPSPQHTHSAHHFGQASEVSRSGQSAQLRQHHAHAARPILHEHTHSHHSSRDSCSLHPAHSIQVAPSVQTAQSSQVVQHSHPTVWRHSWTEGEAKEQRVWSGHEAVGLPSQGREAHGWDIHPEGRPDENLSSGELTSLLRRLDRRSPSEQSLLVAFSERDEDTLI